MTRRIPALFFGLGLGIAVLLVLGFWAKRSLPPTPALLPPAPSPLSVWPWPAAAQDSPHTGVTHWLDTSSPNGTVLELFDFDLAQNPHLRMEIYDQDQDDAHPFDDFADCYPVGVGQATRHLNQQFRQTGRGQVVAAWHGLFFNPAREPGYAHYVGRHVTPVVLNGRVHANVGQARWTFGVQYDSSGRPTFRALWMPDKKTLNQLFTFACGGAQCLIKDGKPLTLHPFPSLDDPAPPQPVPCTPDEAGYIPNVDWIRTSRATMGWSRDNRHFYLLFVKQSGDETGSVMALHGHGPLTGGWTVADEQRFWQSKGVWGAINSDGGDVSQMTFLRPDGSYALTPAVGGGGTLMYFYVRDGKSRS